MVRYTQKPQDISKVLSHSTLASQQQHVSLVQQLNKVLAEVLQLEQLSFCQVSCIRNGRAVILSASAPWLTRLKLQRDAILDNFRKKILPDLAGIDIEASPNGQLTKLQQPVMVKNAHQLSAEAACSLRSVAASSEGALKQALLKLAENASAKKDKTR
jgi:hypothetical protein